MFVTKGGRLSGGVSNNYYSVVISSRKRTSAGPKQITLYLRTYLGGFTTLIPAASIATGSCLSGTTSIIIVYGFLFFLLLRSSSILHYQSRRISRDSLQHLFHGLPLLYNSSSSFSRVFHLAHAFLVMEPTSQNTAPQQARQQPVYDIRNGGHYGKLF